MSIVSTSAPAPARVTDAVVKAFRNFNLSAYLAERTGGALADRDERIVPSDIKVDRSTAVSAMGGARGPESLCNGMLWIVTSHAYGQVNIGDFAKIMPSHAVHAVDHACGLLKFGAGATRGTVIDAVHAGIGAMLTLPLAVKKVKTLSAPSIESTATRMNDAAVDAAPVADPVAAPVDAGGPLDNAAVDAVFAATQKAEREAAEKAEREAAEKAERDAWIAEKAASKAADVLVDRAVALAEFRQLAGAFGIKLSAAQEKILKAFAEQQAA